MKLKFTYILILLFFTFLSINIDHSILPDYEAYERIYLTSELGGDWEVLFTMLMYFFKLFKIDYDTYRFIILFFCVFSLYFLIITQSRFAKISNISLVNFIFLFLTLNLFMLEFFLIRIRAGLCISFIFISISFFLKKSQFLAYLFLILSLFIHKSTFLILISIFIPSFLFDYYKLSNWLKLFSIFLFIFITFLILFLTNNNYEERGIGLNSPLNIFRFIFLTIPPILIFYTNKKENKLNFNFYFNKFYLIFLFGLALFYYLGYTEYSGEALVRVYTLASVPAFFSVFKYNSILENKFNSYIVFCNCLFFLYTIGFFIIIRFP